MRLTIRLAFLALLAFAITPAHGQTLPEDAKLDLFLLVGQSNMAGRAPITPEDKVPNPRLWMLTKGQIWVPAVDPLHFDKPGMLGVGPGRTFAIALTEAQPSAQIGLVPCAFGGTKIELWKKGGQLYTDALTRARAAMARGTFKAILWHQGEANFIKPDASGYWDKLHTLIADFRADLNAPELPFIVGQLGRFERKEAADIVAFNDKLMDFAAREPHCACVSSEGLVSKGDNIHFDTPSQHEFGRRYAAAYLKLLGTPTTSK